MVFFWVMGLWFGVDLNVTVMTCINNYENRRSLEGFKKCLCVCVSHCLNMYSMYTLLETGFSILFFSKTFS